MTQTLVAILKTPAGPMRSRPRGARCSYAPDEAIVQIHGIGPFEIHWHDPVKTLDDADAGSTFRHRRGDEAASPWGSGTIVEGYASGTLIQYEIEDSSGHRFMAHEHELRVQ